MSDQPAARRLVAGGAEPHELVIFARSIAALAAADLLAAMVDGGNESARQALAT